VSGREGNSSLSGPVTKSRLSSRSLSELDSSLLSGWGGVGSDFSELELGYECIQHRFVSSVKITCTR